MGNSHGIRAVYAMSSETQQDLRQGKNFFSLCATFCNFVSGIKLRLRISLRDSLCGWCSHSVLRAEPPPVAVNVAPPPCRKWTLNCATSVLCEPQSSRTTALVFRSSLSRGKLDLLHATKKRAS